MEVKEFNSKALSQALVFAQDKHAKQKRKFNGEPYFHHCIRVANFVREFTNKENIIVAALLHDTIEDTGTTSEDILSEFGPEVLSLVLSVTNDKNELERLGKTFYLEKKVRELNSDSLLIKLADRLDNISDLSDNEWSKQYAYQTRRVFLSLDKSKLEDRHIVLLSRIEAKLSKHSF